jgi:hypothetical protein
VIRLNHRRKLAIATYDAPREANIYGKLTVDASQALAYIDPLRKTAIRISRAPSAWCGCCPSG